MIEVKSLPYEQLRQLMEDNPEQHLEEVPFGNFQLELDLCDDVYDYSEQAGYLRCYVVYSDGAYVGNIVVMASEMLHHIEQLQAVTDSFYIKPEYRGTGAFKALLTHVEDDLRDNKIRFLTLGMNPNMPHYESMLKFLQQEDYHHTEYLMTKELLWQPDY